MTHIKRIDETYDYDESYLTFLCDCLGMYRYQFWNKVDKILDNGRHELFELTEDDILPKLRDCGLDINALKDISKIYFYILVSKLKEYISEEYDIDRDDVDELLVMDYGDYEDYTFNEEIFETQDELIRAIEKYKKLNRIN